MAALRDKLIGEGIDAVAARPHQGAGRPRPRRHHAGRNRDVDSGRDHDRAPARAARGGGTDDAIHRTLPRGCLLRGALAANTPGRQFEVRWTPLVGATTMQLRSLRYRWRLATGRKLLGCGERSEIPELPGENQRRRHDLWDKRGLQFGKSCRSTVRLAAIPKLLRRLRRPATTRVFLRVDDRRRPSDLLGERSCSCGAWWRSRDRGGSLGRHGPIARNY